MSSPRPLISIGLPVHNGASFLATTLDSLLSQTWSDFELIISDNASTDATESICKERAGKDSRIQYYRNRTNIGLPNNFNLTFSLSSGKYFKWATADDICEPEYLERCVGILEDDSSVVLAYPKSNFIDANGNGVDVDDPGWDLRWESARERFRYIVFAGHWNNAVLGLIRSDALRQTRLLPSYPLGDRRLLGELSLIGRFIEIQEYLFCRRLHPAASSQNTKSLEWLVSYYKGHSGGICLPHWSLNLDHLMSVWYSGLSVGQKLSLTRSLVRYMRWERAQLLEELKLVWNNYFSHNAASTR